MPSALIPWLIGGAIAVLLAMLVVVRLARRMEQRDATPARIPASRSVRPVSKTPAPPKKSPSISPVIGLALGGMTGMGAVNLIERLRRARGEGTGETVPARKRAAIVAAGVMAMVFAGIGAAISAAKSEPRELQVSEIIAGPLHGTYTSAGKYKPVVLIVPGSGPTDRDGNNPMGVKANSYALLAEGLGQKGISSVRVDKRGMFGSAGAGDPNISSIDAYVQDYHAWIDAIRKETGVKCVWLLGHSEGALMVSAAAQGRKDVCGLILVSGMGRKMGDVIRQQLKDNPANAPVLDQAFAAIADLEAGRHPDTTNMHPALLGLFQPKVQDFLISVFATDPVEAVRKAGKKTLVVQGTNDLQVTVEDANLLNKAPHTRLKLIEGMNHILKEAPADRAGNIATYTDPNLPLAPKLVSSIASFIKSDD